MSQIFDALHQSQESGNGSRKFSTAKDLLQAVEQQVERHVGGEEQAGQLVCRELLQQFPAAQPALPVHSKLVCFSHTDSLAAEKFRFLATRLRHVQQKRSFKRIVITSSVPSEGKTMVAANLACALAAGKQNVLLVEGDLRRPSLAKQLGLGEIAGLSQLLQDKADKFNNIRRLETEDFCVLSAGNVQTSPMEFMEPGRLAVCLDSVSAGFDWVIIDSPPMLPLADTTIWMRLADAVMLVTRPGVTTKHQLQRALEAVEQSKLLGAVLNASTEATAGKYYYHYAGKSPAVPIESFVAK